MGNDEISNNERAAIVDRWVDRWVSSRPAFPCRFHVMFSRLLSVPVLLAAAVGVPYVATHGPNIDGLFDRFQAATQTSPGKAQAALLKQVPGKVPRRPGPQGPGAALYPTSAPLEGLPALSLHEVFNMNVSKEWVYQRWARKSTALSELGLFGIRVPLVTGTQLHDLAGSLTYYFSNSGRIERISFHGTTGDTTPLAMLVTQQYGLQQQTTPVAGEQLYQVRRKNQIFSELRSRPAPVLWASSPHDSFAVDMDLQRPDATTPLPSRLLPLPVVKTPPPQQNSATAAQQRRARDAKRGAKSAKSEKTVDPKEKWKAFFPRSRVPKKQVESLDRRGQLW